MSGKDNTKIGTILWTDLTVENADELQEFYSKVIGWKPDPVSMGDMGKYCIIEDPAGAVCALFETV